MTHISYLLKMSKRSVIFCVTLLTINTTTCTAAMADDGNGNCLDGKPTATVFSNSLNAINHDITLVQAQTMIGNFTAVRESMLASGFQNNGTMPIYETFNLAAISKLICQPTAIGFRVYTGMDDENQIRFILVGVDPDGKDILMRRAEDPSGTFNPGDVSLEIEEAGQRFP
jgi:hypothetical protein